MVKKMTLQHCSTTCTAAKPLNIRIYLCQFSTLRGRRSFNQTSLQLNVNEFVLTKLDPECGLAQPQLVQNIFCLPCWHLPGRFWLPHPASRVLFGSAPGWLETFFLASRSGSLCRECMPARCTCANLWVYKKKQHFCIDPIRVPKKTIFQKF